MRIPQKLPLSFSRALTLAVGAALAILAFSGTPALAARPWWHLSSSVAPTHLQAGAEGHIVLTAANLGDENADGTTSPVTIADTLPVGLEAASVKGKIAGQGLADTVPVVCHVKPLTCAYAGVVAPYSDLEVDVRVKVEEDAVSGGLNEVAVSGGETPSASVARPVTVSEEPAPFGLQVNELAPEEEGGALDARAGSHPFQVTSTLVLNQSLSSGESGGRAPVALPKNLNVKLPPGLVGNPDPFPRCTLGQFLTVPSVIGEPTNACAAQTAVGVASVTVNEPDLGEGTFVVPVFNLEPSFGEPARFGFFIAESETPVLLDTSLRSGNGEDYGVTISSVNTTQTAALLSAEVTFWGVPGDPVHDNSRGWGCILEARGEKGPTPCTALGDQHPQSFLTMPTSCSETPLLSSAQLDSWEQPADFQTIGTTQPMRTLDGCNQLPFSPSISGGPTTDSASAPSGLDFSLDFNDEGLTSPEGLAQSQLKDTVVTLPEGFTINPSAGVGLGGCTQADYAAETVNSAPGAGCPNESKLGTVEIETPLLTQKIEGSIFIAEPHENPFDSLVALYIVAKNPETGVLVKLAGKVTPNPVTGQLTTSFENNPQLPFDHFNFHFREGQQAPLITPSLCGTYATTAELTPWSEPFAPLTETSSFTITKGFDSGACPSGGAPPFHPGIQSGMLNNNAGVFSPFYLHLTRTDGEQEISGFSTSLPPGLTGSLTGIPFCPEAAIAAARTKTGGEEEANPSCPAASQVGHTLVGTGVGAVLAYVPGKIYLAGPFHGAPFSLVSVTSAVVGPFDLGTVVLRFGLNIDPYTAQVSVSPTSSEPIPTIIDGIVTHVRDIRVYVERPGNAPFTLNPTSCNPMAIGSALTSDLGAGATVASPFQAASCANLKFAPQFKVSTSGKTSKANGASLHVALTYPSAPQGTYANIAKVKVELPKALPSRLTTLQKACTAAQFEANPAGCPSPSVIGSAKAVVPNIPEPLTGPVYFVSHGGEAFPSLEVVLQGYGVKVILVGSTFISKAGITSSTFKAVPDNPVTSFELTLPQGPYSALAANGNLCTQKLTMPTDFTAQNGAVIDYKTAVSVTGCPKKKALTRAQKLAVTLKSCHKDRNKAKRASCEKAARKRYGSAKRTKRSKQKK